MACRKILMVTEKSFGDSMRRNSWRRFTLARGVRTTQMQRRLRPGKWSMWPGRIASGSRLQCYATGHDPEGRGIP